MFFHYKKYFSWVLLKIADANYKFIYANSGFPGSCAIGGIFRSREFYKGVIDKTIVFHSSTSELGFPLPYYLIRDNAFALSSIVIIP